MLLLRKIEFKILRSERWTLKQGLEILIKNTDAAFIFVKKICL
jgi:hypothetical protein